MKTKKSTAFWATFFGLLSMFYGTALLAPGALGVIAPGIVAGLVGACISYQGTNVADNFQRAKHYNPALDREGKES